VKLYTGTSGWAYKEWKGPFYPETLKNDAMLAYYSQRLAAVEVNNTFYRMPAKGALARWRDQVSTDFRFVLKAPQRITHHSKLTDTDSLAYFLDAADSELGGALGAHLFQLPPFLRKDTPKLRDFLAHLPPGCPAAFEFRHVSWFDDEVFAALREVGAALCIAESGEAIDTPFVPTAEWGYLRLRREDYDDAALESWAARLREAPWSQAFVFFKHEDAGAGPKLAARFRELFGSG
jgi:uncharacterized protein YecE (DUF72 family)